MTDIREAYEWLLVWLEDAVSDKPQPERMNRQMQLNLAMAERAPDQPAVAAGAAAAAATAAAMCLRIIADNDRALAQQLIDDMRNEIDNAGTNYVDDIVTRYLP
jgi:hypothetical protein